MVKINTCMQNKINKLTTSQGKDAFLSFQVYLGTFEIYLSSNINRPIFFQEFLLCWQTPPRHWQKCTKVVDRLCTGTQSRPFYWNVARIKG